MSTPTTLVAGRYRLVKLLGAGGMGVVWQAWDERLERPVALKMLRTQPELTDPERDVATNRAMREARITAGLHHPHAVTVYDVVEHEGRPCLVMQLIESTPLSILLREHGTLTPPEVARIGAQVASALAAAHKMRIVHRDVKPGNILITADGSAKISDFGISHALGDATITATGLIHGTPAYLAPEVARGKPSSFASDVFSLGSTLYAMLEGDPPFGADKNAIALLHKVARGGYPRPKHAGVLAPLLRDMLSSEPKRRPNMTAIAASLSEVQGAATPITVPAAILTHSGTLLDETTAALVGDAEETAGTPKLVGGVAAEPTTEVLTDPDAGAVADDVILRPNPAVAGAVAAAEGIGDEALTIAPAAGTTALLDQPEPPTSESPSADGLDLVAPPHSETALVAPQDLVNPHPDEPASVDEPDLAQLSESETITVDQPEVVEQPTAPVKPDLSKPPTGDTTIVDRPDLAESPPAPDPPGVSEPSTTETVALTQPTRFETPTGPTVPVDQPTRFEPATGETVPFDHASEAASADGPTAETEPLAGAAAVVPPLVMPRRPPLPAPAAKPATALSAAPATAPAAVPAEAPTAQPAPRRRRRAGALVGILAVLGALIVGGFLVFNPFRTEGPTAAAPTPSQTPASTSTPIPTPTATTPTTEPAPVVTPTPPPEVVAPPPPQPTGEERVVQTITDYYANVPGNLDTAWPTMTADYQENHAGGRGGYEAFWSAISGVQVSDVTAFGPDQGQATLTYFYNDGSVIQEVTYYQFVDEGGVLKIAASEVISSADL